MQLFDLKANLPPYLRERTRVAAEGDIRGEFVLYWLCSAMRADENPALDVAKLAACHLNLPLLVYQGLSQRYRYASDRHHMFILQGVRDVQHSLGERGISYAFHLERPENGGPHLRNLANQAALVVTEDMPTGSQPVFRRALQRACPKPMLLVDTACVVPMQLVGKAYERAFQFRSKTKKLFADRTARLWPELDSCPDAFDMRGLPFQAVDLGDADLAELVSQCEIDHTVGPVLDTEGGSQAGYRRWHSFVETGLKNYARKRNDALADGVSRMSAYLHHGMVSPFRLARESAAQRGSGAEKFLDELLIWRELAHNFCFYQTRHGSWQALPQWARESLEEHATDDRQHLYTWEQLARGETHDRLWNAAQKSLLIHGELHNNIRMTWGKAILNWRKSPRDALRIVIDLNHRYALDGSDPNSYGGILWCFGQFDRPFKPERSILGTVRDRPTAVHARRLDVERYAAKTSVSRSGRAPEIAVIGAGLSGAIAARTLADHGLQVTVFEKSRGAGGRMASRTQPGEFDHGAQYFTVRDQRFRRYVSSWLEQGLVAPWSGAIAVYDQPGVFRNSTPIERLVAVPAMNSLAKYLVRDIELHPKTTIATLERVKGRLILTQPDGHAVGSYDSVIVTAPAPQSATIVRSIDSLESQIKALRFNPCWAVMLSSPTALPVPWSGAFVNTGPLRWISRNGSKPGRTTQLENIVLHASYDWSRQHFDTDGEEVCERLMAALWDVLGTGSQEIDSIYSHRWRYSIPAEVPQPSYFASAEGDVVACGDWAAGGRVEGAFLSGCAAAGHLLRSLKPAPATAETRMLF